MPQLGMTRNKMARFWKAFDSIIDAVPAHLNLLIKVHPNMQKTAPAKIERCRGKIEGMANISFMDDFPPIYPLLDRTDAYIGDMSSIGYDYLRFGRPMFFPHGQKAESSKQPKRTSHAMRHPNSL